MIYIGPIVHAHTHTMSGGFREGGKNLELHPLKLAKSLVNEPYAHAQTIHKAIRHYTFTLCSVLQILFDYVPTIATNYPVAEIKAPIRNEFSNGINLFPAL